MDTMEPFRGGKCELSNLHVCLQGYVIEDKGTTFPSSEHHYQFKKLKHHDKGDVAYKMLLQEDTFKAMKKAKEALPDSDLLESWQPKEEMMDSCRLKYQSYPHVRDKLLHMKLTIAEATGDLYWGTGLGVNQTKECLVDFWPGENVMGNILMTLHHELQDMTISEDEECRHKAESPLSKDLSKQQKTLML